MYQMKPPCPALGGQQERAASRHNDTPPFQAQVAQVWSSLGGITLHSGACAGCPGRWGWGTMLGLGLVWVRAWLLRKSLDQGWPGLGAEGQ